MIQKSSKLIYLAVLSFSLCASVFGQQRQSNQKHKFEHDGTIESHYDDATKKTTVLLRPYEIRGVDATELSQNEQEFSIMCGFVYQGEHIAGYPETIELHVMSDSTRGYKFENREKRVLSVEADGEQLRFGTMSLVRSKHYAYGSSPVNNARSGYIEELSIILTYQGLSKITEAKKVSLLIGKETIKLPKSHLEALRDLASRIRL